MNYSELMNIVNKMQLKTVYLFTGEEEYLMKKSIDMIKDKYIESSFETLNYIQIDEKNGDFEAILNASETLPFMSPKKLVVVKDIEKMIENENSDFDKKLSKYIEGLDSYLILIIIDKRNTLKKTTSLYKKIKNMDGIVEFSSLKGNSINSWIEDIAGEKNKKISSSTINYFLKQSTYLDYGSEKNLYDLENEFKKILSFSSKEEITREDIDMVLIRTLDTNIFNLLNSISEKNSDEALKIFNEMYSSNEPIQKILFMIIRHLRLFLMYKFYKKKGYNENDIRTKMKISPYEFKKIVSGSGHFNEDSLKILLEIILKIDEKQKTSFQDEKLALEILLIKICHTI